MSKIQDTVIELVNFVAYKKGHFDGSLLAIFSCFTAGGVPTEKDPKIGSSSPFSKKIEELTPYERGYKAGIELFRAPHFRK